MSQQETISQQQIEIYQKNTFELISKFTSSVQKNYKKQKEIFIKLLFGETETLVLVLDTMNDFKDKYNNLNLSLILQEKDIEFTSQNNRKININGKYFSFNPEYYFDMLDKFNYDYNNNSFIEFMMICLDCIHVDTMIKDNYIVYKAIDMKAKKIVEFTFSSTNNKELTYFYKL